MPAPLPFKITLIFQIPPTLRETIKIYFTPLKTWVQGRGGCELCFPTCIYYYMTCSIINTSLTLHPPSTRQKNESYWSYVYFTRPEEHQFGTSVLIICSKDINEPLVFIFFGTGSNYSGARCCVELSTWKVVTVSCNTKVFTPERRL